MSKNGDKSKRRLTAEDRAFLATYDLAKFDRPSVTADVAVLAPSREPGRGRAKARRVDLLLVKRGRPPFKGMWALPGGFLNRGESLEECARRELREETGLEAGALVHLAPRSEPGRDPRGWIVSCPFLCSVDPEAAAVRAADDAAEAKWFPLDDLPPLAFDHHEILLALRNAVGGALAGCGVFWYHPPHSRDTPPHTLEPPATQHPLRAN